MNYLKELQAFREYLLQHHLPTSSIVLWHTLMLVNNSTGWKKKFEASNSLIHQLCGLSRQTLDNARKTLQEKGLLQYIPGKKGTAPMYVLHSVTEQLPSYATTDKSLATSKSIRQKNDTTFDNNPATKTDMHLQQNNHFDQSIDTYPTANQHKPKDIQKEKERRRRTHEEEVYKTFDENIGTSSKIVRDHLREWTTKLSADMVIAAIKLGARNGARTFAYIEKILQEWDTAKIETIEQLEKQQHRKIQAQQSNNKRVLDKLRKGGAQ